MIHFFRVTEAQLMAPIESSKTAEWEKVAKYCDLNPKANNNTKDVGRLRSILLQLKQPV